jgi:1,4-alpha-glucan branching enzyme
MITKEYSEDGKTCQVTFTLPSQISARSVHIYGDFTEWEKSPLPLKQQEDGSYSVTISLAAGKEYRFRYLLDGQHWENDWSADAYTSNPFGTEDSVVRV